jgi:GT2 family glycosyltransferase
MTARANSVRSVPTRRLPPSLLLTPVSRRPTTLPIDTVVTVMANDLHRSLVRRTRPARGRHPRASVIVVTSDNVVFLKFCVTSILANTREPDYELIVVDNGSSDGTARYLDELEARHRHVRVISNVGNVGFAPATNQGLAVATGDALVLLNDDTVVAPGWLSHLCGHLEDATVGLIGPVTNRAGNDCQIPTSYRTYGEFLRLARDRHAAEKGTLREVPMLTMFCLAMRRDAFARIGPLDEQFAVGMFEDDDYAMRARALGLRVVCAEDVFVHHFGATSLGKLAADGRLGDIFQANRHRFEEKWGVSWTSRRCRVSPEYERLVDRIRRLVGEYVPPASRIAVVSRGDEMLLDVPGCTAMHYPQADDGRYAGHHPADSREAIAQLKAVCDRGAEYLLVPATMRWWLEYYDRFADHVRANGRLVADDEAFLLFTLDDEGRGEGAA